jgi:hydrogenase maturation protein HypF
MAALCGLFLEARFEAQAAMGLEMAARRGAQDETVWPVDLGVHDMVCIPPADIVRCGVQDLAAGVSVPVVAMRFHRSLATALIGACMGVRERTGCEVVAAGGGSLQNRLLSRLLIEGLEKRGFRVLVPEKLPPGDGGIALGQAVVARARMEDTLADGAAPASSVGSLGSA